MGDLVARWQDLLQDVFAPPGFPRHPVFFAKFGLRAIRPATSLAQAYFKTERGRALFAGLAAHSILPLEKLTTSAVALILAVRLMRQAGLSRAVARSSLPLHWSNIWSRWEAG